MSSSLTNALRALADATLSPDLADARVEAVKEELMSQLVRSDPTQAASNLAYATAFQTHPYRLPPEGTLASIAALTGNKVRLYHRARFAGDKDEFETRWHTRDWKRPVSDHCAPVAT